MSMASKREERIGQTFTNQYGSYTIIEYYDVHNVIIRWNDKYETCMKTQYSNCIKGAIVNPYYPTILGHGYLGLMSDGSKPKTKVDGKITREYAVWHNMLQRCYDTNFQEKNPSYKGCQLEECLHCYAYFLEFVIEYIEGYEYWLNHPNKGVALDKDIKGDGSKLYSRDTIMFVSASKNTEERIERCGVKSVSIYGVNIDTGEKTKVFDSILQASQELNICRTGIYRCLDGRQATYKNYKWFKI